MKDLLNRDIDYMRLSLTDKCNLRCRYCMPEPRPWIPHEEILRYEEILQICRAALALGIDKFKVTGGEPLVRRGASDFIAMLKGEPGVKSVTLTTNGLLLEEHLPALIGAGIDGINISLDSLDREGYRRITGKEGVERVLSALKSCAESGIRTKVNTVLLPENGDQLLPLASLARKFPVDVRFIELMPIGFGRGMTGPGREDILPRLRESYPDLAPVDEKRGNGPAEYYESSLLKGRLGFIAANSHRFCGSCNRIRLTCTGVLKSCLCYEGTVNLGSLLRGGIEEPELKEILREQILAKPAAHCFSRGEGITENRAMSRIGG